MDNLSAADICKIIKLSSVYGVTKLQIGGNISVEFGPKPIEQTPEIPVNTAFDLDDKQVSPQTTIKNEEQDFRNELEDLLFTDPYAYEQKIREGFRENYSATT